MFAAVPATTFEVSRSRPCGIEQRQIDGADLGLLLAAWTGSNDCDSESCLAADFNGDGRVDGFDMGLFLSAWGNDCTGG